MQSIKLARFCSSSLCATLLTVVLLPHFVTVHAAAAAAPAAAGQQFPWFVFDCCSIFSQRGAVRLFRHCKYLAWTCSCCPWQGHLIQQQSALFRACCSCSYALIPPPPAIVCLLYMLIKHFMAARGDSRLAASPLASASCRLRVHFSLTQPRYRLQSTDFAWHLPVPRHTGASPVPLQEWERKKHSFASGASGYVIHVIISSCSLKVAE